METLGWKVSLSNGETLYEHKGDYCVVEGELSPWNRLLQYLTDNSLTITSISLYTDSGKSFNLPSMGKNPKFHAFAVAPKPLSYSFFNKMGQDALGGDDMQTDLFAVIEAKYEHTALQLWVDRNNTNNVWSLIVEA